MYEIAKIPASLASGSLGLNESVILKDRGIDTLELREEWP